MNTEARLHRGYRVERALFPGLLVAWVLLLVLQSLYGPVDGYVSFLDGPLARRTTGYFLNVHLLDVVGRLGTSLQLAKAYAIALLVVSACSLWVLLVLHRSRGTSSRSLGLWVGIGVLVLVVLNTFDLPYLSNDLYLYRVYGAMQLFGGNPYTALPQELLPVDELRQVPAVEQHSAYGPLALLLFRFAAAVAPDPLVQVACLKLLLVLPLAALLIYLATARALPANTRLHAVAWVGLNPLILLEVFQNAHLEGWIACLLLLAIAALNHRTHARVLLCGALSGLACALKLPMLAACAPIAVTVFCSERAARPVQTRIVATLLYCLAVFAVLVLFYTPYWQGLETLQPLRAESSKLFLSILYLVDRQSSLGPVGVQVLSAVCLLLSIIAGAAVNWRGAPVQVGVILALALQAAIARTVFHPWYVCPILILAARRFLARPQLDPDAVPCDAPLLDRTILVWSAAALAGGYAPFIFAQSRTSLWQAVAVLLSFVPPLVVIIRAALKR